MSHLIKVLNAVKSAEARLALTPSQQAAHRAVYDALKRYGQCNLYGAAICGKTFLGWRIARERDALHLTSPSLLTSAPPHPQGVVVDNALERHREYRIVLSS